MNRNRDRSLDAMGQPKIYHPVDPLFRDYDRSIGELTVDGVLVGHLASVVREMSFPSRQPWLWFVVVWLDGQKENPFEDYGPSWYTVRELDAGRFEGHGPSVPAERRFFGIRFHGRDPGPPTTFEYTRLPPDVASHRWAELGLVNADF